jgi:hypothetical protein
MNSAEKGPHEKELSTGTLKKWEKILPVVLTSSYLPMKIIGDELESRETIAIF